MNNGEGKFSLSKHSLVKASKTCPCGLVRLASFLRLSVSGMSYDQVARLVYWRLTRS